MTSIIIPNYNYGRYIQDCILSCLVQNCHKEIIVVDDASTDNSVDIVNEIPFVTLLKNEKNMGVADSRNRGLDHASGKYIKFLDADDMLWPGALKKQTKYLEKHSNVGMVYGEAKKINVDRKNYHWTYEQCVKRAKKLETYSRFMNAQTLLWRRDVFAKYGGYYEGLKSKEDKELLYRLGVHPKSPFKPKIKVKKLKEFIAVYRRHPEAKHKRRIADEVWKIETEAIFSSRIKELKKKGITLKNTWFPVWTSKR